MEIKFKHIDDDGHWIYSVEEGELAITNLSFDREMSEEEIKQYIFDKKLVENE